MAVAAPALSGFGELVNHLYEASAAVVGQEAARRRLAVLLAQQKLVAEGKADRAWGAIIAGRTGSGKTMLARLMCEACGLPFSEANATQFTESGYTGRDLTTMMIPLLESAAAQIDGRKSLSPFRIAEDASSLFRRPDIEAVREVAEPGVILLDEFDKWMHRINHATGQRDTAVQTELLKMIEGSREWVSAGEEEEGRGVWFDTTRTLIICCGAFIGLQALLARRLQQQTLSPHDQGYWDLMEPADLVQFGVLPELAGRLRVHVMLRALNGRDLARIIGQPGGMLDDFRLYFESVGATLEVDEGSLLTLAGQADHMETGARALDFVLWTRFADPLFEAARRGGGICRLDASGNTAVLE